ncbi:MBOAT family protein [Dysgonomonas sp. 521]|uniref:MBOAT family O-acyltransferase n=1 Tax=Dysgonomonas sp. 521 TaxID=2302932 RepID=UPI0013D75D4F|nr:MBOAT family O-acyltransferase [Dysgonomonas sp. 521]NDV95989.1 MBOAT family protein [Dysgonomonas sp. 521]
MVFSTYSFVFIYLPMVLLLYFGMARYVSRRVQQVFLIVASLVFYGALFFQGFNHLWYVWLIMSSVIVNYSVATGVQNIGKPPLRKVLFIIGVLFNVLLLGYYKYYNFFLENVNYVFDTQFIIKQIVLPIGISFFTFQQIAFLIGVWKREEKVPNFWDYTLFIVFFPQLVAGPIVFLKDVLHQYQDEKNRFFNIDNFSAGLFLFVVGLFKKAVIADTLDNFVFYSYLTPEKLGFATSWLAALSYSFQIFFDFSGYSDMAIGLARMMNINLPLNFYSPYKSVSITEFWKRWHITLGRSLAVLIYYPLGGNRKGLARTCFNLFAVFFVSGIWHGAAWTFIVWGIAHGIVRVFEKLFIKQLEKIPDLIRIFFTFMFVNAAWVLFRSPSFDTALIVLKNMFAPESFSFSGISELAYNTSITYPDSIAVIYVLAILSIVAALAFLYPKNSIDKYNEFEPTVKNAVAIALLFSVSVIHFSRVGSFIYFNF